MKKQLLNLILAVTFVSIGNDRSANAQTLFKDMEPGTGVSSNPQQFTEVNGIVYFITDPSVSRRRALWKTDGTEANTVMVKDSIISTAVTDRFMIRGQANGTLYYTVNLDVQIDTTTELWKVTNGSAPTLVTQLKSWRVNSFSNGEPRHYKMAGGKLYFQMYTDHGYELWVSDGTEAGTKEVTDLFPGSTSGIANGGASAIPMVEFNGKIYFQGITAYNDEQGLYCSDGTSGGTVLLKSAKKFNPQSFTVYKNELYFQTDGGLWKTDGNPGGTVSVQASGFNGDVKIFKNEMFYSVAHTMYKSDGTDPGTAPFKDSVGVIIGMNSKYFLARYMKTLSVAPYYEYYYWRSDGTAAGTVRVADSIVKSSSFVLVNDKMYSAGDGNALWESDGTDGGTRKLVKGIVNYPFVLNNSVFFSNWGSGTTTGYELWSYTPGGTGSILSQPNEAGFSIYPNPSKGHFKLSFSNSQSGHAKFEIYNTLGEMVHSETMINVQNEIDIEGMPAGIYFVKVYDGSKIYSQKIIIR